MSFSAQPHCDETVHALRTTEVAAMGKAAGRSASTDAVNAVAADGEPGDAGARSAGNGAPQDGFTHPAPASATLRVRMDRLSWSELSLEHGALVRQLGALQRRASEQLGALSTQLESLQREVLRLRADLVVVRTAVLWGLGAESLTRSLRPRAVRPQKTVNAPTGMEAARTVICRTGCMGHAHPWLEGDGQCRRSGGPCDHWPVGEDG